MAYKTLNEFKEETHPWKPYIPEGANKLILGTFPTAENNRGAYDFFYPNPNNDFWKILFEVDGKQLSDFINEDPVKMRNQILLNLKLAIADIGFRVLRQKNSSKDQNLFPIEYTDIFTILDTNPEINKIIITSSSGGNSVLSWFQHYCELNKHSFKVPSAKLPLSTSFTFKNKRIKIDIISSPSRLSPIKGDKLIQMYKDALAN